MFRSCTCPKVHVHLPGTSNCPYYARIEVLADQLSANLPDFHVRKVVKLQEEWEVRFVLWWTDEQIDLDFLSNQFVYLVTYYLIFKA